MEVKSSEGRNEEGEVRKKRKRDVDVEAASTEVVASHGEGRNEEGGSKKRRKRVKDGSSVDSVTGTGGNTVGREADSLNEMETEKSDSSNGRKKKKKRSGVCEPPPLQEATNEKLGDAGVLVGDDEGGDRKGGLEKSVEDATETDNVEHSNDRKKDKKKKKKKKHSIDGDPVLQEVPVGDNQASGKDIRHARDSIDETTTGNSEDPNDRKKEKKKRKHRIEQEPVSQESPVGDDGANTKEVDKATSENSAPSSEDRKKEEKKKKKKKQRIDQETESLEAPVGNNEANTKDNDKATTQNSEEKKKKKKKKSEKKKTNQTIDQDQPARTKSRKSLGNRIEKDASDGSPPKSTSKRVSFSEDLQVFPISNDDETSGEDKDLVRGKRFSPEEDEMVKAAVLEYIDSHALGDEGLNMIMHCKDHKEVKNCWKEIGLALPWRPNRSVYSRAHILFERDGNRKWTPEECELVMKYYEKHGADWKTLGEAMGKHRVHVKDTFRRLKVKNPKFGKWSQDEYQTLFDLVNADLRMKVFEERKSKHGMLKDNISWEAISDKLETRSIGVCCNKWYTQLTSPMVQAEEWLDEDDYLLVMELYNSDACCMEDVDWDNLLEHRAGELCRKRWNQMVRHLGDTSNKSFAELVEILTQRYCFDVLEARQVYRSKPLVD